MVKIRLIEDWPGWIFPKLLMNSIIKLFFLIHSLSRWSVFDTLNKQSILFKICRRNANLTKKKTEDKIMYLLHVNEHIALSSYNGDWIFTKNKINFVHVREDHELFTCHCISWEFEKEQKAIRLTDALHYCCISNDCRMKEQRPDAIL